MKTRYVLVTPVHNEERFIPNLIKSIGTQTLPPIRWVIVDDASSDQTPVLLNRYVREYGFLTYLRLAAPSRETYYSRRTRVVLAGIRETKDVHYDFLGVLDADISLGPTYYEDVLRELNLNPKLGIASGVYADKVGDRVRKVPIDRNHPPGAIQVFSRECYDAIGGYVPQKYGGDDTCAEITARMLGWETRSFSQYRVIHNRPTGTGNGKSVLMARFGQGLIEYGVGTHPVFMLAKSIRRAGLEWPYVVGSAARLLGFAYGYFLREERGIPPEIVRFLRQEQLSRLAAYLRAGR